jgi:hypothetical protein
VSVEHWFDSLSRPRTRRTALKAAALAGAGLVLPAIRVPRAAAAPTEPCFTPCNDAALAAWDATKNGVRPGGCKYFVAAGAAFTLAGHVGPGGVLAAIGGLKFGSCLDSAELTWHRALVACRNPECGDHAKYPGGRARECSYPDEIACGNICCNALGNPDCCSSRTRGYVCCGGSDSSKAAYGRCYCAQD